MYIFSSKSSEMSWLQFYHLRTTSWYILVIYLYLLCHDLHLTPPPSNTHPSLFNLITTFTRAFYQKHLGYPVSQNLQAKRTNRKSVVGWAYDWGRLVNPITYRHSHPLPHPTPLLSFFSFLQTIHNPDFDLFCTNQTHFIVAAALYFSQNGQNYNTQNAGGRYSCKYYM